MANLDDRARRAAAQLHAQAEHHVDPDAGLNRIRSATEGTGRRWWPPRLLAAVAAVTVVVAGVAVIATRSGPAPVAEQPAATAPALSTVPSATVLPTPTTVPLATTTAPSTAPSTVPPTVVPSPTGVAIPTLDVEPLLEPLDLPGCAWPECSLVTSSDGVLVALDATTGTFTVDVDAGPGASTVIPLEPLGENAYLVAVGPERVAYVAAMSDPDLAPAMDLVVIALTGDRVGQTIERRVGVVDGSGDTDLVPTREGLVAVGCCGSDSVRPDPAREPLIRWLTPDGEPTIDPRDHVSVEWVDGQAYGVVRDSGEVFVLPATSWFRGMPFTAAVGERDYAVAWWEPEGRSRLVRANLRAGVVYEIAVPADINIVAVDVRGAVVADTDGFYRWNLPSLAHPQDVTARVNSWVPDQAESSDALVQAVLAHLRTGDGCETPPTAEALLLPRRSGDDRVVVGITHRQACDDSVGGAYIEMDVARDGGGSTWRVEQATSWPLCLRGGSDLCV